ncbi:head-tail connector protein [Parapedomonas caeni]
MPATLLTDAGIAPVSLAEARAYLRLDLSTEDAEVAGLVRVATQLCEAFTGQVLLASQWRDRWPLPLAGTARLTTGPVRAIAAVAWRTSADDRLPLAAADWQADLDDRDGATIRLLSAAPATAVWLEVDYWAGLAADWNGLPEPLRLGILRLVAHLHAHRDAPDDSGPPLAVAALWRPYRRMRLQ